MAGASGYVGERLVPEPLASGYRERRLARSPGELRDRPGAGEVQVVRGDVTGPVAVGAAMRGGAVACHLVHPLGTGRGFEDADRAGARVFGARAARAGGRRIARLGGLTPAGVPERELSPDPRCRSEAPSRTGRAPPRRFPAFPGKPVRRTSGHSAWLTP